jgi:hypothetical protein
MPNLREMLKVLDTPDVISSSTQAKGLAVSIHQGPGLPGEAQPQVLALVFG